VLAGITALVSVVLSATVSLFTIRMNREQAHQKGVAELAVGIMPRRLDALEAIWAGLFAIESAGRVENQELDKIIRSSIWLPPVTRELVLSPFIDPDGEHDIRAIRKVLHDESGTSLLDKARTNAEGTAKSITKGESR
jgi:hypothetical protein